MQNLFWHIINIAMFEIHQRNLLAWKFYQKRFLEIPVFALFERKIFDDQFCMTFLWKLTVGQRAGRTPHTYMHTNTLRGVSFAAISASWHGALLREQTSLPKASNRFLVSRIRRYHGTGVPNSSNSHYCPGLNLTPGNNIWPPRITILSDHFENLSMKEISPLNLFWRFYLWIITLIKER